MKKNKLLLSVIVSTAIVLFVNNDTKPVSATTPTEERHFAYTVSAGKATITDYTGDLEGIFDVVIPNTLGGNPVEKIDFFAMSSKQLTSVIIPNSITRINGYAFTNNKLTTINIPNSVTYVDGFSNNLLTSITIPTNATEIGAYAFSKNKITDVVIPKNITKIGTEAFATNKLANVRFLSANAILGTNIFASNQVTPANLIIEGYSASTIESHASLKGFTFISLLIDGNKAGVMKTSVLPGVIAISSFPSVLSFENYEIGLNDSLLHLQSPFKLAIDDFTGSYAGWNLSIAIEELADGTKRLINPTLNTNLTNLVINDANNSGLEAAVDTSPINTFSKTDGAILFGSVKKILSAQTNNLHTTGRHYLNFPLNSLQISFDNSTRSGTFTGTTTFTLIASP